MGCACQGKNKTKWEVVTTVEDPKTSTVKERVVFSSTSKPTAEAVGKRYAGSTLREVPPKQ
ncbi:hypothetical protein [Streptomyces althioticus]|uniref:hypothetical protein n=1 Tax=Streptomyces althioticus TaxID=83380 RepID=UPI001876F8BA|nr:hypothetical protein GCM10010250_22170 [Streptomyces althioticus]